MTHFVRNTFFLFALISLVFAACQNRDSNRELHVEEGYKTINGTEIYYKKMGDGEPVVIVHGGPVLEHGYLVPYFKPLADRYELVFFDQRLSGRSSAEVDSTDVRLKMFVDDIEGIRQAFGFEKIHLLAHSWGGLLAMNYALNYSSNLHSLVLLNSMPASSKLWNREEQVLAQKVSKEDSTKRQEIINSELFKTNPPEAIEQLLKLSFRLQFYNTSMADSLDFYIPDDYMVRSRRFGNLMIDIANYDLHEKLSSMEVPTLLIYGETEPAVNLSGPKLNETIPRSTMVVIKDAGHFPFVERPEKVITELRSFLNDH